jgi:hypothetical protein
MSTTPRPADTADRVCSGLDERRRWQPHTRPQKQKRRPRRRRRSRQQRRRRQRRQRRIWSRTRSSGADFWRGGGGEGRSPCHSAWPVRCGGMAASRRRSQRRRAVQIESCTLSHRTSHTDLTCHSPCCVPLTRMPSVLDRGRAHAAALVPPHAAAAADAALQHLTTPCPHLCTHTRTHARTHTASRCVKIRWDGPPPFVAGWL